MLPGPSGPRPIRRNLLASATPAGVMSPRCRRDQRAHPPERPGIRDTGRSPAPPAAAGISAPIRRASRHPHHQPDPCSPAARARPRAKTEPGHSGPRRGDDAVGLRVRLSAGRAGWPLPRTGPHGGSSRRGCAARSPSPGRGIPPPAPAAPSQAAARRPRRRSRGP